MPNKPAGVDHSKELASIRKSLEGETLEEWLTKMRSNDPDLVFLRQRFPKDEWKDEYLATIATRPEQEVLLLIKSFLIQSLFTNQCDLFYTGLMKAKESNPQFYRNAMNAPFIQRLVKYAEEPDAGHPPPWEGNTWIAELLPDKPKLALQGLEAYVHAYRWHFSDNQIWGHDDVEQLIRAKFIGLPGSNPEAIRALHDAGWRKLECLVERMYFQMGYDTELTPPTSDGGRDVIAKKSGTGAKEVVLIDCKLYTRTINVKEARTILGTMNDYRATKGVIVSTGLFSEGAHDFAARNPIELIDGDHLIPLMNHHLGSKWALRIDHLAREALRPGVHAHKVRG